LGQVEGERFLVRKLHGTHAKRPATVKPGHVGQRPDVAADWRNPIRCGDGAATQPSAQAVGCGALTSASNPFIFACPLVFAAVTTDVTHRQADLRWVGKRNFSLRRAPITVFSLRLNEADRLRVPPYPSGRSVSVCFAWVGKR